MKESVARALRYVKLVGAAILFAVGLAGLLIVMKEGVVIPGSSGGHNSSYALGWSLFFFLMLGLPCLAAAILGAIPWIAWWRKRGKKR